MEGWRGGYIEALLCESESSFVTIPLRMPRCSETFEKRLILFKVKEGENFNRPAWDIKRDKHPYIGVFRGLKFVRAALGLPTLRAGPRFEPDAAWSRRSLGEGGRLGKRERFSKVSLGEGSLRRGVAGSIYQVHFVRKSKTEPQVKGTGRPGF